MDRRRILAFAALAVLVPLAGCETANLEMTPVDDAALVENASRSPADLTERERELLMPAVRTGSSQATHPSDDVYASPPIEYRGRYYGVERERGREVDGRELWVLVDYNASTPRGTRVDFADLPAADRRRLEPALAANETALEPGPDDYYTTVYNETEAASSALDGNETYYVEYRGRGYVLSDLDWTTKSYHTATYTATVVAEDDQAFATYVKERYAFTPANLSEEERAIVEKAIDEGVYGVSGDDEAFGSLVDRFLAHEPVSHEADVERGTWLVRYEGKLYWADLYYEPFEGRVGTETTVTPSVTPR